MLVLGVAVRIIAQNGSEIARTFTTVTCGTGCRGSYSVAVSYKVSGPTGGTVEVFDNSAKDGAPENVVSIPVTLIQGTAGPGLPTVSATPGSGPVGTRVHIEGDGFTDPMWNPSSGGYLISLDRALSGCEAIAFEAGTYTVSSSGHFSGGFVVPPTAGCFQSDATKTVSSGTWTIIVSCHACFVGTFEVTKP